MRGYKNGVLTVGPLSKTVSVFPETGAITLGNSTTGINRVTGLLP